MEITQITITVREEQRLRAFVKVVFDNEFIVHGKNGLFVSMPSRRLTDGTFRDVAHPITSECRERLEKAILAEYRRALEERARRLAVLHT